MVFNSLINVITEKLFNQKTPRKLLGIQWHQNLLCISRIRTNGQQRKKWILKARSYARAYKGGWHQLGFLMHFVIGNIKDTAISKTYFWVFSFIRWHIWLFLVNLLSICSQFFGHFLKTFWFHFVNLVSFLSLFDFFSNVYLLLSSQYFPS